MLLKLNKSFDMDSDVMHLQKIVTKAQKHTTFQKLKIPLSFRLTSATLVYNAIFSVEVFRPPLNPTLNALNLIKLMTKSKILSSNKGEKRGLNS